MPPDKKKDALTDLVGIAGSESNTASDQPLKEGEAITPSGEIVTMGVDDDELTRLARKLLVFARAKTQAKRKLK